MTEPRQRWSVGEVDTGVARMHVEVVGPADLPAATRWQAVSFLRLEWPEVFSGAHRRAHQTCPPAARPVHVLVTDAETLVSCAVVMRLRATAEEEQLEVAGFGSLTTFPQYRGEGWARAVVATASAWIAGSAASTSACSSAVPPWHPSTPAAAGSARRSARGQARRAARLTRPA